MTSHRVLHHDQTSFTYTGTGNNPNVYLHLKFITDIIIDSSVYVIHEGAFLDCCDIANVDLNEGLERIESAAFQGCVSLASVVLPSTATDICSKAFAYCDKLVHVHFNEGLVNIGDHAFRNCTSLESVILPSTIRVIDEGAFSYAIILFMLN